MQTVLRLNLMFQMALHRKVVENRDALVARLGRGETVNIEGYELASLCSDRYRNSGCTTRCRRFAGRLLIVQVKPGRGADEAGACGAGGGIARCRLVTVQEEPFWKEIKTFYQRAPELTRVSLEALGVAP